MRLFDRMSRLLRANANDLVQRSEDPETMLEQSVMDLQEDLVQLRQSVASAISSQRRSEQQYHKATQDFGKWHVIARLASDEGDEKLYREAIFCAEEYIKTANDIKEKLDGQEEVVKVIKRDLVKAEREFSDMKTRKDFLKSRLHVAKFRENQYKIIPRINQLIINFRQEIDKSETTGLHWLETKLIIQTELEQLPQTLERAVANQALLQRQYNQAVQYESNWQQKAQAAAVKNDEALLAEALAWKKTCNQTLAIKKTQIDAQSIIVKLLQQYLILLENQMYECQSNIDRMNKPTA
jgi:phage shock protein A